MCIYNRVDCLQCLTLRKINVYHMQWLKTDFLGYLKEWESSVNNRDGFTDAEKATMKLSRETLEGLHITGKSVITYCVEEN